jgi:hypothetical protein
LVSNLFQFNYWSPGLLFVAVLACAAQDVAPEPHLVKLGGVTLQPSGFVDVIGMSRSASTPDSISTKFGNLPLVETDGQSIVSLRNSRLDLMSNAAWEGVKFSVYLESDFLNTTPQQSDYRWRQYWARARFGKWELLGGQAWSLLRPNRRGTDSDRDGLHTDVIDAAYHVGLLGSRRRQVRLARSLGDYKAVFAWEGVGNFLTRVMADKKLGHLEATAFTGRHRRRGVTASAMVNLTPRLRFITQEYWSKRAIFEALGVVGTGPNGMASIQGLEWNPVKHYELYSYAGLVCASRWVGNRLVREWTVGAERRWWVTVLRGEMRASVQLSHTDRSTWAGQSGDLGFVMYRVRYTFW